MYVHIYIFMCLYVQIYNFINSMLVKIYSTCVGLYICFSTAAVPDDHRMRALTSAPSYSPIVSMGWRSNSLGWAAIQMCGVVCLSGGSGENPCPRSLRLVAEFRFMLLLDSGPVLLLAVSWRWFSASRSCQHYLACGFFISKPAGVIQDNHPILKYIAFFQWCSLFCHAV